MSAILEVRDLRTVFRSEAGTAQAVDGISLQVGRGETLALVGEVGLRQVDDRPVAAAHRAEALRPYRRRGDPARRPRSR